MGVQISRRIYPEVSPPDDLQGIAKAFGRSISKASKSKGESDRGIFYSDPCRLAWVTPSPKIPLKLAKNLSAALSCSLVATGSSITVFNRRGPWDSTNKRVASVLLKKLAGDGNRDFYRLQKVGQPHSVQIPGDVVD